MKILSAQIEREEKEIGLKISHKGKKFRASVIMVDGLVIGDAQHGLATSYLPYFELPLLVRTIHFNKIKEYLESNPKF